MNENLLNKINIGTSVVYNREDGSSVSAIVTRIEVGEFQISYRTAPNNLMNEWVQRRDFGRVQVFPKDSKFLVSE